MSPRQWLQSRWYSDQAPPLWLRPFAGLYRALLKARTGLYARGLLSSGHPGVPVLVAGNLTVGGTGKTPLVIWLAGELAGRGWRVGVVSRGHGGRHARRRGPARLVAPDDDPADTGDEALLLARDAGCPVAIGADRLAAARLLASMGCRLVIADDGLQHLALRRDVEIAVVDGERGFGNGALLPAGPLREPVSRLRQVDAVVFNGPRRGIPAADSEFTMRLAPLRMVSLASGEATTLSEWRGRDVHAVAGIGNPGRFFATLRELGMRPREHAFPDHHPFRPANLQFGDGRDIVMTAKDAVKCAAFVTGSMWYLQVATQFDPDDAARLLQLLESHLAGMH
jgi:tetraacyldisaccharide 4'-kinase